MSSAVILEQSMGAIEPCSMRVDVSARQATEPVFVNNYGAQESIPRDRFRQPM